MKQHNDSDGSKDYSKTKTAAIGSVKVVTRKSNYRLLSVPRSMRLIYTPNGLLSMMMQLLQITVLFYMVNYDSGELEKIGTLILCFSFISKKFTLQTKYQHYRWRFKESNEIVISYEPLSDNFILASNLVRLRCFFDSLKRTIEAQKDELCEQNRFLPFMSDED
ncbi:hypothetical protein BDF20DRAFT_988404 [Mycotypha africana]|uniref:uncharacterized protein n=1 Tax=Mycotypha africana TaxID=64632 RepID=UPI0023017E46|nr:uncharacterized protein BDF20DRAFT_988404 [Mycotypha africana]KAI8977454.1 hypothetical protein BDF20DRAFT_988404 [Mycotypha africana]